MKIMLTKTLSGLKPTYDSDYEKLKKIPLNETLEWEVKQSRNIKNHRRYFALMNLVFHNQELTDDINILRSMILIKAGYYVERPTLDGEVMLDAKSLSFSNMDELEFQEVFSRSLDVIVEYFKFDRLAVQQEISNFY